MAGKWIFINFCQMTHFNDLKSEIFLYHTVQLLKSCISITSCLGVHYDCSTQQRALSNFWGRYDQYTWKFHRLWQIIVSRLCHKAKAHEFSFILALAPTPPLWKHALLRRGRWSFFLPLACKKRSSFRFSLNALVFHLLYKHYTIAKQWLSNR